MMKTIFAGAVVSLVAVQSASAQTTAALTLSPWEEGRFVDTHDKLLYQEQGHVKGEDDRNAQVFWWDSTGRVRFNSHDPQAFSLGYRYLTVNFDTNSGAVPDTLDDLSLAAGIHLGDFNGWKTSAVLGLGYASDNLFADVNGLYGVGHLLFDRQLNADDTLIVGLGYDGNSALLPDVPLPEFAWRHRGQTLNYSLGFPTSALRWSITPELALQANYAAPLNGDVTLEYTFSRTLSVFGNYTNFFNGFHIAHEDREERIFYGMQRVEVGVHYQDPALFHGLGLDAALVVGYAFDQQLSRGFDIRDRDPFAEISDQPYIGLVLVGSF